MPELPEVETVRRTLESVVIGKKVRRVLVYRQKNIDTDPIEFVHALEGQTIESVKRKGKLLAFVFSGGNVVTSHLRMEGKYFYQSPMEEREKHDILRFEFESGDALVYNDVRKFGRLGLYPLDRYETDSPFAELGPEPMELDPNELYAKLQKRHGNIKEALMDQTLVAGIGNIYCDETLFATSIHPLTPCREISLKQCIAIQRESSRILNEAIEEGGSTVRSYHPGKGIDGMMQSKLLVYGREHQPCAKCGFPLTKTFVNGRGTTYCPKCQKNPHRPFVLGVTGPIHAGKSTVSKHFEAKGYLRFDADEVAKSAYLDPGIKKAVIHLLGRKSYEGKKPNLPYIRERVAVDPKLKKALEGILHPYVFHKAEDLIAGVSSDSCVVLDVPLLFQSGMDTLCDATLLVVSEFSLRASRLAEEGKDVSAMAKINAKYPVDTLTKKASFVIHNDAGIDKLIESLEQLGL